MHSKIDNSEIMINNKAEGVIGTLFESILNRYQIGLETSMRISYFIFDCVYLLYYKFILLWFKCDKSYIEYPAWIKSKRVAINPVIKKRLKLFSIGCNSHVKL